MWFSWKDTARYLSWGVLLGGGVCLAQGGFAWGVNAVGGGGDMAFRHYLAQRYALLALTEDQENEIEDSQYLRGAQVNALAGGPLEPHPLDHVRVVSSAPGELQLGRTLLMRAAENGAVEKMPGVYARALSSYDCWVEQQEAEPHAAHNLNNCRRAFLREADRLASVIPVVSAQQEPTEVSTLVLENLRTLHSVFFPFDRYDLTSGARRKLDEARAMLTDVNNGKLIIRGFADASGPEDYNMRLSERRAHSVADYLGLPSDRFETRVVGYGETQLHVPTKDGVREAANRVVDISVDAARVRELRVRQSSSSVSSTEPVVGE